MLSASDTYLEPGTWLARKRYRIERFLSEGSFGQIYLATDHRAKNLSVEGRRCVVKRLKIPASADERSSRQLKRDFAREARLLVTLNDPGHTHIPEIYEYLPRHHCLVMKYIEGYTLWDLLRKRLASLSDEDVRGYGLGLPESEALRYVRSMCDALVHMHSRSVALLHRDLNPANALVDQQRGLWLIDFGISRALGSKYPGHLPHTQGKGTDGFTAPEQWRGRPIPASDIFSLAATLYTLLTSETPPALDDLLRSRQRLHELLAIRSRNRSVRYETEQLVWRGMAINGRDRPTAAEFLAEIDRLLQPVFELPAVNRYELPASSDVFVGRVSELEQCERILTNAGVVGLVGMAGVGKSTLAYALARRVSSPEHVFRFTFNGVESEDQFIWAFAEFFARRGHAGLWTQLHSVHTGPGNLPPAAQMIGDVIELLQTESYTLLFDDLHLAPTDHLVETLVSWLREHPGSNNPQIIMTSRQFPAYLPGSAIFTLQGLRLDEAHIMLERRGVLLEPELAERLWTRTEGNPQLLTLAIQALKYAADPTQLIDRLISAREAADLDRYLRLTIFDELSEDEREVMAAIALEGGVPTTSAAVSAILGRKVWRSTLSGLRDRHLVIADDIEGRTFRQHAIVQEFYRDQLEEDERYAMHRQASGYYDEHGDDPLRAAWHAASAGDSERTVVLLEPNRSKLLNRGQAGAALHILQGVSLEQLPAALQCDALLARGVFGLLVRDDSARDAYEQLLRLLTNLPDVPEKHLYIAEAYQGLGELLEYEEPEEALKVIKLGLEQITSASPTYARLLVGRGTALMSVGMFQESEDALREALTYLDDPRDEWRGRALVGLSRLAGEGGNYAEAGRLAREALILHQQNGNLNGALGARQNLALTMDILGNNWNESAITYEQGLNEAIQLGSVERQTEIMLNLGILRTNQGQDAEAERLLTDSRDLARRHNMSVSLVHVQSSLSDLLLRGTRWSEAEQPLVEAQALATQLSIEHQIPEIMRGWALFRLAQGRYAEAFEDAEQSIRLAMQQELGREVALGTRVRGEIQLAVGTAEAAAADFEGSLGDLQDEPYEYARSLQSLGRALIERDTERARKLLTDAIAIFKRLGAQRDYEQTESVLRCL
jgi:serine/threonine protein kinase/tetratricopeptide (TPR) repeat protein